MTSYVENETSISFPFDMKEILDAVMEQVLTMEECPYEAQVNMLITDEEGICQYNREYRQINAPTDVLSFPMVSFEQAGSFELSKEDQAGCFDPESGEIVLGDIIISAPRVFEQAEKYGHSVKREFAFLTAHSMLHLCGYDHVEEKQAKQMEEKQEQALTALGITRKNEGFL